MEELHQGAQKRGVRGFEHARLGEEVSQLARHGETCATKECIL